MSVHVLTDRDGEDITVYRVIFYPCNFRPFTLANSFAPSLNSPRYSCINRDIICNIEFALS